MCSERQQRLSPPHPKSTMVLGYLAHPVSDRYVSQSGLHVVGECQETESDQFGSPPMAVLRSFYAKQSPPSSACLSTNTADRIIRRIPTSRHAWARQGPRPLADKLRQSLYHTSTHMLVMIASWVFDTCGPRRSALGQVGTSKTLGSPTRVPTYLGKYSPTLPRTRPS